jgi:hypothetical protein
MMKRIVLLTTLAAMMAAAMALSGVAQAKPISGKADVQCLQLAIKTLGPSFNPGTYNFVGGTEGNDRYDTNIMPTAGPDVICGFGGDDLVRTLAADDIFLGGEGLDRVTGDNYGTVYGGEGDDYVSINYGTFNGEAGDDSVADNRGGTYNGGDGSDFVGSNSGTLVDVP